jgi:hypothetical protein
LTFQLRFGVCAGDIDLTILSIQSLKWKTCSKGDYTRKETKTRETELKGNLGGHLPLEEKYRKRIGR